MRASWLNANGQSVRCRRAPDVIVRRQDWLLIDEVSVLYNLWFGSQPARVFRIAGSAALIGREKHPPTEPLICAKKEMRNMSPALLKKLAHLDPERHRQKAAWPEACGLRNGSAEYRIVSGRNHEASDQFLAFGSRRLSRQVETASFLSAV